MAPEKSTGPRIRGETSGGNQSQMVVCLRLPATTKPDAEPPPSFPAGPGKFTTFGPGRAQPGNPSRRSAPGGARGGLPPGVSLGAPQVSEPPDRSSRLLGPGFPKTGGWGGRPRRGPPGAAGRGPGPAVPGRDPRFPAPAETVHAQPIGDSRPLKGRAHAPHPFPLPKFHTFLPSKVLSFPGLFPHGPSPFTFWEEFTPRLHSNPPPDRPWGQARGRRAHFPRRSSRDLGGSPGTPPDYPTRPPVFGASPLRRRGIEVSFSAFICLNRGVPPRVASRRPPRVFGSWGDAPPKSRVHLPGEPA